MADDDKLDLKEFYRELAKGLRERAVSFGETCLKLREQEEAATPVAKSEQDKSAEAGKAGKEGKSGFKLAWKKYQSKKAKKEVKKRDPGMGDPMSMSEVAKASPPGKAKEVEELKEKGLPDSEAFGIAWNQYKSKKTKKSEKLAKDMGMKGATEGSLKPSSPMKVSVPAPVSTGTPMASPAPKVLKAEDCAKCGKGMKLCKCTAKAEIQKSFSDVKGAIHGDKEGMGAIGHASRHTARTLAYKEAGENATPAKHRELSSKYMNSSSAAKDPSDKEAHGLMAQAHHQASAGHANLGNWVRMGSKAIAKTQQLIDGDNDNQPKKRLKSFGGKDAVLPGDKPVKVVDAPGSGGQTSPLKKEELSAEGKKWAEAPKKDKPAKEHALPLEGAAAKKISKSSNLPRKKKKPVLTEGIMVSSVTSSPAVAGGEAAPLAMNEVKKGDKPLDPASFAPTGHGHSKEKQAVAGRASHAMDRMSEKMGHKDLAPGTEIKLSPVGHLAGPAADKRPTGHVQKIHAAAKARMGMGKSEKSKK